MKYFPSKKEPRKRKLIVQEGIRSSLPKPKIPRKVIWKVHDNKNIYFD